MGEQAINALLTKVFPTGMGFAFVALMQKHRLNLHISSCAARRDANNSGPRRGAWLRWRLEEPKSSARGRMIAGGGTHAPVIKGTAGTPLYNRRESPTQTRHDAATQVASMEVWGAAARGSAMPSVKAYRSAVMAPAARGVEFCSNVSPTAGKGTPFEARWYIGSTGVVTRQSGTFAAIPIYFIKNTQVP